MDKRFKINDNRPISTFVKNSFMGEPINISFTKLKNMITREPDIDKILYTTFDLLISGKCVKLYQFIITFYSKSINIKNPSFPFLFYNRYSYLIKLDDFYRELLKGDKSLELIYRNDQGIRNHLTEMMYILVESNKCKNPLVLPGVKDMPPRTPAILNFTESFIEPGDAGEVSLALNEFIFFIRNNEKKKALRWLSWIIQVEKLKLKMRQFIAIKPREISGVAAEYKADILWIFWNYILSESRKRDTVIHRQATSLFNIYKYNFNPKARKIHLLLTATAFISEFYSVNTPLVMNMPRMIELNMKSNILFNSFKNNEKIVLDLEEKTEGKKQAKQPENEKLLLQNEIDRILLEKTRVILYQTMFFGMTRALFDSYIFGDTRFYYLSLIRESDYASEAWSIHGLWPQYSTSSYPSFCKKVDFSLDALRSIMTELQEHWYSNTGDNPDFWKHEYTKHGSCMFKDMTELEYFTLALNLFNRAITLGLPEKYYNSSTGKCLIPVNLDFTFKN